MSNNEWRMCRKKHRYRDEHAANYYRRIFEQERGKKLDYYWCPQCNGFHLTSREYIITGFVIEETDNELVALAY